MQLHNSSTDYAKELIKPLKDAASLLVCSEKNFFGFGFQVFCECCHKLGRFLAILAQVV